MDLEFVLKQQLKALTVKKENKIFLKAQNAELMLSRLESKIVQ